MMIRRLISLLFVLLMLTPAFAQDDTRSWHLAFSSEFGELVRFTPRGDTMTLLESGVEDFGVAFRLADGSSIVSVLVNDTSELYHVTENTAEKITLSAEVEELGWRYDTPLRLIHSHPPYATVIENGNLLSSTGFLINTETNQMDSLTGFMLPQLRIAADGTSLRYASRVQEELWHLIERDLATGEENTFYTIENRFPTQLNADTGGDHWLHFEFSSDGDRYQYSLIRPDGSITSIDSGSPDDLQIWQFFGDALFTYPFLCEVACIADWRSIDEPNTVIQQFPVPTTDRLFLPFYQINTDTLLIYEQNEGAFYRLQVDEAPLKLGTYDPMNMFTPQALLLTPDGRFLSTGTNRDDTTIMRVWELGINQIVYEAQLEGVGSIFRPLPTGFLFTMFERGGETTIAYHANQNESYALPDRDGFYFDIGEDGRILHFQPITRDNVVQGIYHFDPATGDFSTLVENVMLIPITPMPAVLQ